MTTPVWAPGTIYSPGALVQPLSATHNAQSPPTNANFEAGNTGWTLGSGFSIVQDGVSFDGTWALKFNQTAEHSAINDNAVPVSPGQSITGSCQVQAGSSCGARCEIGWYDASDDLISFTAGSEISNAGAAWMQSNVTGTAPAGAAFARFVVTAFRVSGTRTPHIDACVWNAVSATRPAGLIFRAVQAIAGFSGASEPVWPIVNGATVVDNEVTWEAVFGSRVVWEASPILVSGSYEPNFPEAPDATVADGTIKWVAMNWRVTQAPHSKIVEIGASKIFAADKDIIAFSATVNALDWTTPQDAGYIPFGLNSFGSTPATALGLYRSNLVIFNSEAYQMWQIDEDPANMAILDASPVACLFPKSVQPVSNDLVMCTPEGVRNIGIAGASTNLQAGYFGAQVDPLVLAKIRAGLVPFALFWPSMGQYWLIFETDDGSEAFVLTMNGGAKDQSWSRYLFPETLTDWAILNGDLYLRMEDRIWRVDPEILEDDAQGASTGGTVLFVALPISGTSVAGATGMLDVEFPDFIGSPTLCEPSGSLVSGDLAGYDSIGIATDTDSGNTLTVGLRVPTADLRVAPQSAYFTTVDVPGVTSGPINVSSVSQFTTSEVDVYTYLLWKWSVVGHLDPTFSAHMATFDPISGGDGIPFEGYIAWPYLDFGILGIDKMMEGFDVVANGTFRVSFGYSQRDFSLATPDYALDGDTLVGGMVPMPLTAPSFQLRLTFDGSQAWEWFASNLYINNEGPG